MNLFRPWVGWIAVAILAGCTRQHSLVGSWSHVDPENSNISLKRRFNSDGTWQDQISAVGGRVRATSRGRFETVDGQLTMTITEAKSMSGEESTKPVITHYKVHWLSDKAVEFSNPEITSTFTRQ